MLRQRDKNSEIMLSCIEEKYYKGEVVLEHHSFVRIISGEMKIIQSDQKTIVGVGSTLLIPRNQLATFIKYPKDGKPYKSVVLTFTTEKLKHYYSNHSFELTKPQQHRLKLLPPHQLFDSYFAAFESYFDVEDDLPSDLIDLKIEEAMIILRSVDKDIDYTLADFSEPGKIDLAEFMEKNFMFNMTMEKFGYLTGRSLTTFKRDFKKSFKSTPQRWLTQKRLELAHYYLSSKDRKPVDVYLEVGFENLSHFSFVFKKQFGYAPTEIKLRAIDE
ncbi:AraC family transcriptional regulator [Pedobacter antarcticus]|uniref:helix-turn-helix domain-containing protein n=1 Tax=Pedobacter antarcticus TaxID=34086 RepID=UPI00292EEE72|nr:AraC family transcriptional regulator [Pedobacter antarcticus]